MIDAIMASKWKDGADGAMAMEIACTAPTISTDSMRERGRWEKSRYDGFLWCSVCKNCYVDDHWPNDEKWKYCPNCGARMGLEG